MPRDRVRPGWRPFAPRFPASDDLPRTPRQPRARRSPPFNRSASAAAAADARVIFALQTIRFSRGGRRLRILFPRQALRVRLRLEPRRLGFAGDPIGLGLRGNPFAIRSCLAVRRLLPLCREGLFLLALDGDCPRIFRRLHRFARGHRHRLAPRLACLVGLGLREALLGLLESFDRKTVRAYRARDLNGVAGFVEFQWQL